MPLWPCLLPNSQTVHDLSIPIAVLTFQYITGVPLLLEVCMRTNLSVLLFFFGFSFAASQALVETGVITVDDGEVWKVFVERSTDNNQGYLVVQLKGGGFKVYNAKLQLLFKKSGVRRFVYSSNKETYLHDNLFYFIDSQEMFALSFNDFNIAKASSGRLLHDLYTSFYLYTEGASEVLVAVNDSLVDVYQFPSLAIIAQIKEKSEFRYYVNGLVIYNSQRRNLFAFNVREQKLQWKIDAGERKAKFLGISLGTFPQWWMGIRLNPDDNLIYSRTMFGDLYKINPRSGEVVVKKEQFRGDANNAGLLGQMYFRDMNGDGKNEIVAPSVDENIYCIDPKDFSVRWAYDTGNENQMPLAFYDVNGDSIPDVFGVNDYDWILSVIDGANGTHIADLELEIEEKKFQTYPLVADMDGDGQPEIITQRSRHKLVSYKLE